MSGLHSKQTLADGIHGIVAIEVADLAARLAYSYTSFDLNKVIRQLDTGDLYVLLTIAPTFLSLAAPTGVATHKTTHENGGADEINVGGLSGVLADPQTPDSHASSHQDGGADEIATVTPAANAIPKAAATGYLTESWLRPEIARSMPTLPSTSAWHLINKNSNGAGATTASLTLNRIRYVKHTLTRETTLRSIAIGTTTTGAGSCAMAIYSMGAGIPGAFYADLGTVSLASSGHRAIDFADVLVPPGEYFFAVWSSVTVTALAVSTANATSDYYDGDLLAGSYLSYFYEDKIYGTGWPATATPIAASGIAALVALR
jgi:hypothetical protein